MRNPQEVVNEKYLAAAVVFSEVWPIVMRHKKTALLIFLVELWIHSLMFRHLHEIKEIKDAFPFLGTLLGP